MKSNTILISIIAVGILIAGAIMFSGGSSSPKDIPTKENVSVTDSKQIIEITAKGGYVPRATKARAGMPTTLRFNTNGTFDCTASVRIPSMNITKILPNSGTTDIDLGTPQAGVLQGTCGMGMYRFKINFQS